MSQTTSATTGRRYGLKRVCRTWERSRSALYARRARWQHPARAEGPRRRGPTPALSDAQLLAAIRNDLARSPFQGEGHRKVHARLRIVDGIRVSRTRVLRVMRAKGLLSPHRGRQGEPKTHDGTIVTSAPDVMWGTDGVRVLTVDDGWVWTFAAVDHWNAECVGWHVCKVGDRFAALEPVAQGLRRRRGSVEADAARGLALRMDHGSQYLSDHFLNQVRYWGIRPSFGLVAEPETNGVVERWNRTLKEQAVYGRVFQNLADVRAAVAEFVERYNRCWRLEKLAYRTPLEAREEVFVYRVAARDPIYWIVLLAKIWHKSCVGNAHRRPAGDTSERPRGRLNDLEHRCTELTRRERELRRENRRQKRQIDGLQRDKGDLQRQIEHVRRENERLRRELAAAQRAGRRQAAPFAKDRPQGRGRRPGRRAGADYGRQGCRRRPTHIDETHAVPVPAACPDCGGAVTVTRVASQYQEELPAVRSVVRRFDIEVGHCSQCQRRVQGRHVLQTSDALGAAGVQLGPGVVALVVELHTELGVPLAKVAHLLRTTFGLHVTPGGLAHLLHRAGRAAAPTYAELCAQVRNAPVVTPDETGWRVGAVRHWLWAFVTPQTTVYAICSGRGFNEAATVLGTDYAGVLVRDGWAAYRRFGGLHQTCLNHLFQRCKQLRLAYPDSRWAGDVQATLRAGLDLRDRCHAGEVSEHGMATARGRLTARLGRLVDAPPPLDDAERFAKHLATEFPAVFLFLSDPSLDATNWRAEQAIRPAVVIRKVCGGNRTRQGADTQQVLASVVRTARQRNLDLPALIAAMLHAPEPVVPELLGLPPPPA